MCHLSCSCSSSPLSGPHGLQCKLWPDSSWNGEDCPCADAVLLDGLKAERNMTSATPCHKLPPSCRLSARQVPSGVVPVGLAASTSSKTRAVCETIQPTGASKASRRAYVASTVPMDMRGLRSPTSRRLVSAMRSPAAPHQELACNKLLWRRPRGFCEGPNCETNYSMNNPFSLPSGSAQSARRWVLVRLHVCPKRYTSARVQVRTNLWRVD